jgi:hypothetical protein
MCPDSFVLRVSKVLPQPQTTVVSTYVGWIPAFMGVLSILAAGSLSQIART